LIERRKIINNLLSRGIFEGKKKVALVVSCKNKALGSNKLQFISGICFMHMLMIN